MLKHKTLIRLLVVLLLAAMVVPLFAACSDKLEENEIAVTWHLGKITSDLHKTKPEQILDGEEKYSYSDPILLEKAGTTITFSDDNTNEEIDKLRAEEDVYVISHWVDKNGNWAIDTPGDNYQGGTDDKHRAEEIATSEDGIVTYTYTSTYDNEYVRLCYRSGQTKDNTEGFKFARVYVEKTGKKGTLESNPEYVKLLDELRNPPPKDPGEGYETFFNELYGKTVLCIGDSYMDDAAGAATGPVPGGKMWIDMMAEKYNFTLYNHACSGSTASTGGPAPFKPMVERLTDPNAAKTLYGTNYNPDIIFFDAGRNDFAKGVPLGTLYTDNNPDLGYNTDVTCFYGALNVTINTLKQMYPNAVIVTITCWKQSYDGPVKGKMQEDFARAMVEVSAVNGVACMDNRDQSVVNMDNPDFREYYCKSPTDISHLNGAGMQLYFPVIEAFTAEAYKATKG